MSFGTDPRSLNAAVNPGQEFRILAFDKKNKQYCFVTRTKHCHDDMKLDWYGIETVKRYIAKASYVFECGVDYPTWSEHRSPEAYKWASENCIEQRKLPMWWLKLFDNQKLFDGPQDETIYWCEEFPSQTPQTSKRSTVEMESLACRYRKTIKRKDTPNEEDGCSVDAAWKKLWDGSYRCYVRSKELEYYI